MKAYNLYRLDDGTIVNENTSKAYYDELWFDAFDNEREFPFANYEEWLASNIKNGSVEKIVAYKSDKNHVYPFYFFSEDEDVWTITELYRIYHEADYPKYGYTFADFLNIPQVDRNGADFYGFYMEERKASK